MTSSLVSIVNRHRDQLSPDLVPLLTYTKGSTASIVEQTAEGKPHVRRTSSEKPV